jgi:UDP-N-acetylmuramoyl-tripeptide--D-alanyl-D-alanine ligase
VLTLQQVLDATRGHLRGAQPGRELGFSRVVVDSRLVASGALFVALRGQKHDGHAFVAQALARGAAGAVVERVPTDCAWADDPRADGPPLVLVESSERALADMARYALDRQPQLEVIGITGSLGKTTTKEVVAGVLGSRRRVLKTEGNLNSEIGLPMSVLNGLGPGERPEVAVLEMGMYTVGDIRYLARLARPRLGVVTAVLPVHLERLGTMDRIQQAKQELVEELPAEGVAVLNADDPRVSTMAQATRARVVRYGVAEDAAVRAENIQSHGLRGVEFDLLHVPSRKRRHVHLPLLGAHSVHAALAATAVALEVKPALSLTEAAEALHDLTPALRLLVVDGINGSRIIDDSYNASPESVLAALNLLRELPGRRKIAVLGDMLELGSEEAPGHRRVGTRAAAVLDLLVVFGQRSRITAEEARRAGLGPEQVLEAGSIEQIVDRLRSWLRPGDDVLVKGSLAMGMSEVVRGIRAEGEG